MNISRTKPGSAKLILSFAVVVLLIFSVLPLLTVGSQNDDSDAGSRHICPKEAMRNGTCAPSPGGPHVKTPSAKPKQEPRYERVSKQASTATNCNVRIQQAQKAGLQKKCDVRLPPNTPDLPLASQKIGVTIWHLREARPDYEGARILTHPSQKKRPVAYQAERMEGQPTLTYGEFVRLSIESPRDGLLYVINRELYNDGSLSSPYLIFPTARLRNGDNRIYTNRPVEIPDATDEPFYFEAKHTGLDPSKSVIGEIISIIISDKTLSGLNNATPDVVKLSESQVIALEKEYTGRAEVFELERGVGLPYSDAEQKSANEPMSRLLTHTDAVPQTFFLVEDKRKGGLMVTLALSYNE
ncbi:MAG TPA: hypothetical protein VN844_20040 [Pyrinomonadaceae bacterium]|nr:hypothetical protein [Pyrinomonadaceae bacterium]